VRTPGPPRPDPDASFARVALATTRIVARRRDPQGAAALLAAAPVAPTGVERNLWRGRADALALRARHSDPVLHAGLAPAGESARRLFDAFEQARVEALGAVGFPGMRSNLSVLDAARAPRAGDELLAAVRAAIGAPRTTAVAAHAADSAGAAAVAAGGSGDCTRLARLLHDQRAFALEGLALLAGLALQDPRLELERDARRDASASAPGVARASDAPAAPVSHPGILRRISQEPRGRVVPMQSAATAGTAGYHAYTRRFDAVVDAIDVCDPQRRPQLQRELDAQLRATAPQIARWAHRLQRHLLARQMRSWQFDLEEGVLDAARLTRLVTDPLQPLSFKQEAPQDFPLTALTLLVDCSGSMRGAPIAIAAATTGLLGSVLERCGVRTEILGFTTARWRGGRSREQWIAAGRPADPGRLTDLLHLVFKDGDTPWRRARRNLAAMLEETLLKENVDGEALEWACERLQQRSEPRRILLVVSDGAPLDDATLAANDFGYLDRHLRVVIERIERRAAVELYAIGIGHNVGAHYPRAFTVSGPGDLGEAMVAQLIAMFSGGRNEPSGSGGGGGGKRGTRHRVSAPQHE
jgi:cobaltochelatase CobT